jgi:hypothetical protein
MSAKAFIGSVRVRGRMDGQLKLSHIIEKGWGYHLHFCAEPLFIFLRFPIQRVNTFRKTKSRSRWMDGKERDRVRLTRAANRRLKEKD